MTSNGIADGSWELKIFVTDFQAERILRVRGDLHIGGVMLKLAESLVTGATKGEEAVEGGHEDDGETGATEGEEAVENGLEDDGETGATGEGEEAADGGHEVVQTDWSDHGLFWPAKCLWLSRTKSTLDQYGVQADCRLEFTPMHKTLMVVLPDLQRVHLRLNFSVNVFSVVVKMCKELGIRHPEELSLAHLLEPEELKKNKGVSATRRTKLPSGITAHNGNMSYDSGTIGSPMRLGSASTPQGTLLRNSGPHSGSPFATMRHSPNNTSFNANGTMSPGSTNSLTFDGVFDNSFVISPTPVDVWSVLYRPKNFAEKARINAGWLDSSRSLMEQGIHENSTVLLRFKFYNFYNLSPKYDSVRINQIYEQARWALISEEIDCTEEEMVMFAALQMQVQQQNKLPQPDLNGSSSQPDDEIDAALTDLQVTLEGSSLSNANDIMRTPELHDYLRFFKPKKFSLKSFKRYYFVFKDTHLSIYKTAEDQDQAPIQKFNLRGSEVVADVNVAMQKFNIKLFVPLHDGLTEMWIRQETEDQYAHWMAAIKLASKGRTMADSSYEMEVKSILSFLKMHHPAVPHVSTMRNNMNFDIENYVAPRFLNKMKSPQQMAQRILEAQTNVCHFNLVDAKLNFIKIWQSLPEFGLTYFIVKLKDSKKEELLAVSHNRMIRMDLTKGDSLRTWSYQNMKSWSVNWEIKQVQVEFEGNNLAFQCLTADCKVVHEFIGGYIFLSMRSGDKNQTLNEELFHKLTGGWE